MGGKSSKAIITPATAEARGEGTMTQLSGKGDEGDGEGIGPVEAPVQDGEGEDCTSAEKTATTHAADNATTESTMTRKKSNLMHYVSKKFSFKGLKASKKANHNESPTDAAAECVEAQEGKDEQQPVAEVVDAEVKSDEVPNGGRDDANVDSVSDVEVLKEPVECVNAMSNGFHEETGAEVQYGIDGEKEGDVTVPDKCGEVSAKGQGLVEKTENCKIDPTMPTPQTNGVAVYVTNGEAVTTTTATLGNC